MKSRWSRGKNMLRFPSGHDPLWDLNTSHELSRTCHGFHRVADLVASNSRNGFASRMSPCHGV